MLNNLGHHCTNEGTLDRAKQYLDASIELNPELHSAYHNRAKLALKTAMRKKQPITDLAIDDIERTLASGADGSNLHLSAACIWYLSVRTNRLEKAEGHVAQAIDFGYDPRRLSLDYPLLEELTSGARGKLLLERVPGKLRNEPPSVVLNPCPNLLD